MQIVSKSKCTLNVSATFPSECYYDPDGDLVMRTDQEYYFVNLRTGKMYDYLPDEVIIKVNCSLVVE
jgi:hypothetical protein